MASSSSSSSSSFSSSSLSSSLTYLCKKISSLSLMASSSRPRTWTHNVFTSFHGPDVRKAFLSHLRKQFSFNGISMFNDQRIERGQTIGPALKQAIRESRISIVVLSNNYASSRWCLDELVEIFKCKEDLEQIVMTIFYGVDPSDVRKQTGDFGRVFNETCARSTKEDRRRWSQALTDAGNIAGEHNWDNEADMIEKIAREVSDKLNSTVSRDFEDMVGIEGHLMKLLSLLHLEDESEALVVGIFGPAGIGKTTIARALYSRLFSSFQLSCFMENVSGSYKRNIDENGLKMCLQEQLLSKILNLNGMRIYHLGAIQERLHHQKVLIILDNVDDLEQLEALANKTSWFGHGSRIIVTTKDQEVLEQHDVNITYHVDFPTKYDAREILCRYAFKGSLAPDGFEKFVERVTKLCGNLPLALRVIGSTLRKKKEEDWECILHRLENSLDPKIEGVLRVGYDNLHKDDQLLFLLIAIFFNYQEEDYVKAMVADYNLDVGVGFGLKNLAYRSLIQISTEGKIVMHKLLQQVGREANQRQTFTDSYEISNTSTTTINFFDSSTTTNKADVSTLQLLSNNHESLFDSPDSSSSHSDGKLILSNGKQVSFHRCILSSRSPFFKRALSSSSSITNLELKEIAKDYDAGFDSVVAVLAYVYSGRVRPPPKGVSDCADESCRHVACRPAVEFMVEVLYLASVFEIPELVTLFQRHLLDVVDKVVIEDTLVILKLANICGESCKKLFDRCREIIVKSDVDLVILGKSIPEHIVKEIINIRKELGYEAREVDKHVSNILKAIDLDDLELVELLLTDGYASLDDACALHFAVAYCDVTTAMKLINMELADVNRINARGYTVLHVAAMRKDPDLIVSLITKGANVSETSLEGRTALLIAKQVTMAAEYDNVPETAHNGRMCVQILEQANKGDPIPGNVTPPLAVADDELELKLLDLEDRVTLAQHIFPMEARVAMRNAQMKEKCDFKVTRVEPDRLTGAKRTSLDLNKWPFEIIEKQQRRLKELSKTVEIGRRFFPRCSAYLDQIMDCGGWMELACKEDDTPDTRQQKKQRYMEIMETAEKTLSEDKKFGNSSLTASSSSTSKSTVGIS